MNFVRPFVILTICLTWSGLATSGPIDHSITAFISEMGDAVFALPSKEVGAKVAKWNAADAVNPEELGTYAEGDIVMSKTLVRNGLAAKSARWPGGKVPYRISDDFNYKDYNTIMAAMDAYHKQTCIKWVRWSGEDDYVHFVSGNTGCWSSVGRVGGMQELNLQSPGCLTKNGTVIHEMMHAIGFLHEQNRSDRDSYVDISWGNIQKGRDSNFQKASADTTDNLDVVYDYRSVMHYSDRAFSANGQPTIRPKIDGVELGQREGLSRSDVKKIRKMYNCP